MLFSFSDVACPIIPSWDFYVVDSTATTYGTVVNVSCEENYKFLNSSINYIISTCASTGDWEPEIEACKGKTTFESNFPVFNSLHLFEEFYHKDVALLFTICWFIIHATYTVLYPVTYYLSLTFIDL